MDHYEEVGPEKKHLRPGIFTRLHKIGVLAIWSITFIGLLLQMYEVYPDGRAIVDSAFWLVVVMAFLLFLFPKVQLIKIEEGKVRQLNWFTWHDMDLDSVAIVEYPAHRYPEEERRWKRPMLIIFNYTRGFLHKFYISAMFEQDRKVVDALIDILHARERDRLQEKEEGE